MFAFINVHLFSAFSDSVKMGFGCKNENGSYTIQKALSCLQWDFTQQ